MEATELLVCLCRDPSEAAELLVSLYRDPSEAAELLVSLCKVSAVAKYILDVTEIWRGEYH